MRFGGRRQDGPNDILPTMAHQTRGAPCIEFLRMVEMRPERMGRNGAGIESSSPEVKNRSLMYGGNRPLRNPTGRRLPISQDQYGAFPSDCVSDIFIGLWRQINAIMGATRILLLRSNERGRLPLIGYANWYRKRYSLQTVSLPIALGAVVQLVTVISHGQLGDRTSAHGFETSSMRQLRASACSDGIANPIWGILVKFTRSPALPCLRILMNGWAVGRRAQLSIFCAK